MTAHRTYLRGILVGAVLIATFARASIGIAHVGADVVGELLLAASLCFAAWHVRVDVGTKYSPGSWTIDRAVAVTLLFALGPWQTVFAVALATFVGMSVEQTRSGSRGVLADVALAAAPIAAGGAVLEAVGEQPGALNLPVDFGAYGYVILTVVVVTMALDLALAVTQRGRWRTAMRDELERWRGAVPQAIGDTVVGAGFAAVLIAQAWALVFLVPLGVTLYLSMRRGRRLEELTNQALESFANVVDERDPYTAQHSSRVCDYAMRIGEQLEFSPNRMNRLFWTSRLHDLGKIAVDNSILNKPGKLTDEEFEVMKLHPVVSARILSSFTFDEVATDIVLCHHERYDGRGYLRRPRSEVPFEAFVIAVADSFDAMTSDRPYRRALPDHVALAEIARNLGTQFDPVAGQAFLDLMGYHQAAEDLEHERAGELGSAGVDRVSGREATPRRIVPPMAADEAA